MGLEIQACQACAMAKRRCEKQKPCCIRCKRRGIECTYPPAKPSSFVLCEGEEISLVEYDAVSYNASHLPTCPPGCQTAATDSRGQSMELFLSGITDGLIPTQLALSWFTSPDTWKILFPQTRPISYSTTDLKRYMGTINQWLTQWVEKGSNPFIHHRLYHYRFPCCLQDAYMALTCYLHKTSSNEQAVFKIIEDRAKQLVSENRVHSDPLRGNINTNSAPLDSLEHIARVHSLLVYQILGLYDGDIRLRHVAENHMPVLRIWLKQMVEHASQAVFLGDSVVSAAHGLTLSQITDCENLPWYSWILAESIRRTWLISSGIHAMYLAMRQGCEFHCLGGMMFTTRKGVWEARSAPAWEKLCSEMNIGLMQMAEAHKLFTETSPEDVNDFTKLVLEVAFGVEKMERWASKGIAYHF